MFNYPVRPSDVKARLTVTQDGAPVAVEVNSAEPDAMVAITFMQEVRPGTDWIATVRGEGYVFVPR